MKTMLSGTTFLIDRFPEGWGWSTDKDESDGCFPSSLEAVEDAMRHVRERRKEMPVEDEPSYEQQHWMRGDE